MDWADDITYSVHDLEDFYRAGRVPLHLLSTQTDDRERNFFFERVFARHQLSGDDEFVKARPELERAFNQLIRLFPPMQEYRGTLTQRASLRNFTSWLIGRYVNAIEFDNKSGPLDIKIPQVFKNEVRMLKELTWIYVIGDPALATQQLGQRHMIRHLFDIYNNAAISPKTWNIFPIYYQERLEKASDDDEKTRICVDLIAGMTETQVHRIHGRLVGTSSDASLNDPLR